MKGNIYSYVRVPAKEQNEDRRLLAFAGFRCFGEKHLYG